VVFVEFEQCDNIFEDADILEKTEKKEKIVVNHNDEITHLEKWLKR